MKKIIVAISLIATFGCASGPDPKDTVFEFIDAVKSSDSLRVISILDIDSYIKTQSSDISPDDSATAPGENRVKIIQSLLGDGEVRQRWLTSLIVVNKEAVQGNLAEVEVSFIDRQAGHQLYTKMQLERQPDRTWRITYFR